MKILVVHQYYLMPGAAGGSRFNEFARLWTAAGHQVTVVAGTLDYQTQKVPERYHGHWIVEEWDGPVRVLRCYVPPAYANGFRGRMWAFAGYTLSALTAVIRTERPDVVIATSPPLVAALPGWVAARLRRQRTPWIFEIRDLWPESAVTTGVLKEGSLLTRGLYALERWASWSADKINVLTPAFRDDLVERGLAASAKIAFVPNGADVERFKPGARNNGVRTEFGWGDRFVVLYAGAHGRANALDQLVEAARLLHTREDVLFVTVGDGAERQRLEARVRELGLENFKFHGSQPKERMPDFVNACDVGAAVLQDNPTFRTVYPNKVFDYMACERPTLLAIDGVARKLVCDDARAGVFVPPENPEALAASVVSLAADAEGRAKMGRSGRAWVLENVTREALAARYLAVMEELTRA